MTRTSSGIRSSIARTIVLTALALCLLPLPAAPAQPVTVEPVIADATAAPGSITATVGPVATASLVAEAPAIPVDGTFAFNARVEVPTDTASVQVRLKVFNPSGRLMFQRTRIQNQVTSGTVTARFERGTSDLDLEADTYPVELEVRVTRDGEVTERTLTTDLLLYDPTHELVPVAIAVRVSGQPLADPQGRFVADPGQYTRARDEVTTLASWLIRKPSARLTMAISPLLLEEWKRISGGYQLVGPEGITEVPATAQVPNDYAAALETLKTAVDTGRLELSSLGYTDPDLSALADNGMGADVVPQYAEGISTVLTSAETTPSTGTVPAEGCIPAASAPLLSQQDVSYAVVRARCTRSGNATASAGLHRVQGAKLTVLVADDRAARAIAAGAVRQPVRFAFEHHLTGATPAPYVIRTQVGAGQVQASAVIAAADSIADQPWIRLACARDLAGLKPADTVRLVEDHSSRPAPAGYWADVASGRAWARALEAATKGAQANADTAKADSLIAQCSAWSEPSGQWALADRGRAFADQAERLGRSVLERIRLKVEPITLAGAKGSVPIIITNNGTKNVTVDVIAAASGGVRVSGPSRTRVTLRPKDNFVEVPVDLQNALRGTLTVTVSSAGLAIDQQSVVVRASYLDRLVLFGLVIVALGIMLAFIIRRVRAAEAQDESE